MKTHLSGPSITDKEINYILDAAKTGWYENGFKYINKFQDAAKKIFNKKHALALPSCTSAIHLSLLALGIGPGDEVIVPDITWIATVAPVIYVGATPIFADVDPDTWCISASSLQDNLTSRTKAVISVDLYGGMPDYDAIRRVLEGSGAILIEDAAEAMGSTRNGLLAGSFGDIGVFSLHGSKTVTAGEGGLLITDMDDLADRASFLGNHGRVIGDKSFFNTEVAYKYKMSNLQAACALGQIERLDELVAIKRNIFSMYREELKGVPDITMNFEPDSTINTYWMVTIMLKNESARDIISSMEEEGIDCRPVFYPLSSLPAITSLSLESSARENNKVSYALSDRGINLPSGMDMDKEKIQHVCNTLKKILGGINGTKN